MKVCLPEEVIFLEGEALEKYDFWGYKASYLPTAMAIHCLLYLNYTQQQSIFLNQFNILFNLCSCLCWWLHCSYQKMRIETKHSTTWEIFVCVHLYGVVCFFQVRDTCSFVFLTCDVFKLITDTLISMRYNIIVFTCTCIRRKQKNY